jgi:hypothetical protein
MSESSSAAHWVLGGVYDDNIGSDRAPNGSANRLPARIRDTLWEEGASTTCAEASNEVTATISIARLDDMKTTGSFAITH